jgi:hypothetical protein
VTGADGAPVFHVVRQLLEHWCEAKPSRDARSNAVLFWSTRSGRGRVCLVCYYDRSNETLRGHQAINSLAMSAPLSAGTRRKLYYCDNSANELCL